MDQGSREEAGAARSQNVVHVIMRDAAGAARLLAPAIGRHERADDNPAVLILTPSSSDATAVARALAAAAPAADPRTVPLTSAARARRLLQKHPTAIIAPIDVTVALIRQSELKLASLGAVAITWADEVLSGDGLAGLETILAEVPRNAERIALITHPSAELDAFLDRAMWRARKVTHITESAPADIPFRFVVTPHERRDDALRLLLDALDPDSVAVVSLSDTGDLAARRATDMLGYAPSDAMMRVVRGVPEQPADLVVLFDDPEDADVLRAAAAQGRDLVVLVPVERVPHLRAISGPSARPLTFSGAFAAARSAADALRDELRETVAAGAHIAQMNVLEPLASTLDPVEVAAAAVSLLVRERQKPRAPREAVSPAARPALRAPVSREAPDDERSRGGAARFTRVFLSVGERDGIRRGDLVGAIAGEGGITGSQIGKIELRESHSVVEIESDVAAEVIGRISGAMIRGKRVSAREDRTSDGPRDGASPARAGGGTGRPGRSTAARGGGGGGAGARGERGARPRAPRDEGRPARGGGRDAARPGRSRDNKGEIERVPRAAKESAEWAERAERLRHARRAPGGAKTEGEA